MKSLFSLLALLVAACATPPAADTRGEPASAADDMDAIARDYVRLQLTVGEKEEGYIDAYYGPAEIREAARAEAAAATLPQLRQRVAALIERIGAVEAVTSYPAGSIEARRSGFLRAQLVAADTRLRMLQGERLSFADEARGPVRGDARHPAALRLRSGGGADRPASAGPGPLNERVEAFQQRFTIPADRLDAVMRAATAECRRRTLQHIALPAEEQFTLEFVTNKSWSGYNYYQGNYRSLIQINTDLPIRISRAVDLGCHEGYPGHHVYNVLLERNLARGRGWAEYTVYPLYSPQSLIAEGSANYGYDLAFPGPERLAFETRALYPLAGIPTAGAARYLELQEALQELSGARFTIARDFLEGRITREQAISLSQRYQLVSAQRAGQLLAFTEQYRSYVINYGLGREMVAAYIERQGADQASRWDAMERILSEPTLPSDLVAP
jgi:hypothetical protein